jgi:hypothetical protein
MVMIFTGGSEEEHGRDCNRASPEHKCTRDTGIKFVTGLTMGDIPVGTNRSVWVVAPCSVVLLFCLCIFFPAPSN